MALGTDSMKAYSIFAVVSGRVAYNLRGGARRVSTGNYDIALVQMPV